MSRPRNPSDDVVYVEGALATKETAKALLVMIDGDEKWVPKSVIHDDSEVWAEHDEGCLAVKKWFGEREGWT